MARNKYPEVTEERILDVAQRLFLEKGYENTTIQDIVDELGGLTKGAVYHHFKSKDEIMDAVGDRMFLTNNPFEAVKTRSDLNGLEKLREAIRINQSDVAHTSITVQSIPLTYSPRVLVGMIDANRRILTPTFLGIDRGGKPGRLYPHRVRQRNCRTAAPAHQPVADALGVPRHQGGDAAEVHLSGGDAGPHGRAPV